MIKRPSELRKAWGDEEFFKVLVRLSKLCIVRGGFGKMQHDELTKLYENDKFTFDLLCSVLYHDSFTV